MEGKNEQKPIDIQEALQVALRHKAKLRKELHAIDREISAYKDALRLANRRLNEAKLSPWLQIEGKSRPQACAVLMKEMGGQATITELIPRLISAGLIPADSQKAWHQVRTALEQRLDLFTKVGAGRYALVESVGEEFPAEESFTNGRPPKPIKDSIFAVLGQEGKPLHYKVILEKLQKQRITVSGKDPRNTLLAHLSQDSRFKNVDRGLWGLSEWVGVPTLQRLLTP